MNNKPRKHIEDISNDYLKTSERTRDSLAGAVDRLQKAFSRRGHFIMEFIQNADDAGSNQLTIEILDDKIQIFNDGKPFMSEDVESICKVGCSSKPIEDYIGYLGVGFKSVFLISENPQIYSIPYRFEFNKNRWGNVENIPWQIMPIWIEKALDEKWNTAFVIPLKNPEIADLIRAEIAPERLDIRIMLFLRNLKEITIGGGEDGKRNLIKENEGNGIYLLEERGNGYLERERWLVFRKPCEVPLEVKEDYVTKEWEREKVKKREVVVAFKLNEENELEEVEGTAHIGAFSFLPLKEEKEIGIKFLLQADFLTAPGREVIAREAKWNQWLAKEIFNLIVERCVPELLRHEKWKMNCSRILYPGTWGHLLFDEYIKKPLRDYLENNPVLIAEDGSPVKPVEAVSIEASVRNLLTESDLKILYPGRKVLHANCQPGVEVEEGPETIMQFVKSPRSREIINQKAKDEDVRWFKELYCGLDVSDKSELVSESIILTNENEVVQPQETHIKPEDIHIPTEIEKHLKFVHPDLTRDPKIQEFLKELHIEKLTGDYIQNVLKMKEIPKMSTDWINLSDSEKIKNVKFCKESWRKRQVKKEDLGFLTLKAKSGNWLPPHELVFSSEYRPYQKIEELMEKGWLDLPLEFVSEEFIKDVPEEDIWDWRRFFEELGVGEKLDPDKDEGKRIVQRIGIKFVIYFENKRGREARELGESEIMKGYDIESKSSSNERHIEVKGSTKNAPDVFLSVNELKPLQSGDERYFIYVVGNVYQGPILRIIKGAEIQNLDHKIIIPSRQWKRLVEEEFRFST